MNSRALSRPVVGLVLTLVVLAAGSLWAAPTVVTLANGLTLIVEEDHSAPVAAVYAFVGTGSDYEDQWLGAGLSHLLEHSLDEGTTTHTREQVQAMRAQLGNNSNAWTTKDTTAYYIVTSGAQVLPAVDHVTDYVFHAALPEDQIKTQQGIILREMARGDDDPGRTLYDLFDATMFRVCPEGYPIIGYAEQFKQLTRAEVVAYYQSAYVPGNIVLSVVGDFSAEAVIKHLRETLGDLPPRAYRRPVLPSEPPQTAPRRAVQEQAGLSRAYLMLGYRSVTLYSPDMYPLDVAAYILGNGDAARLPAKLRDELGLVDGVEAFSATPAYDAGAFGVSAVLDPAKLPATEQAVLAELRRLQSEPVSAAELARAKAQKEADLVYSRTSAEGRATAYGSDYLTTHDVGFSERYVAGIRKVTAADIRRVARRYFVPEHLTVAVVRPPVPAGEAASAAAPTAPAQIERATLKNGLRLLVQENHSVPVVNLFLACPGGLRYERDQQAGITSLLAQMLMRGTTTRSRLQLAQALENVGGSLAPYSGRNSFGVSAQVLKQHLPLALEIAADVLRHPTFPAAELAQQKQLTLAALAARGDDVDTYASDLMLKSLFPHYPYRFPTAGTVDSVRGLTKADLFAWHRALCRPQDMVLAVFGDTTLAEAKAQAERWLGDWTVTGAKLSPAAAPAPPARHEEIAETRPQQQAVISYGFPGPLVKDPERYQRDVMNAVLAGLGYPGGRLHQTLRDAQLVYATWAYALPGPEAGLFTIYAGTAPDKVAAARARIEQIIHDLQAAPPTAEELALAKQIALASHAVELQSSGERAQTAALNELMGLGAEEMFRYTEGVQQVTAEQVQAQARKWLDLEHCVVVVTRP